MAINNPTTASSSPLARTDTPQPTAQPQAGSDHQQPRLYAVEPRTHTQLQPTAPSSSTRTAPVTVTQAPQLQVGANPNSPRSQLHAAAMMVTVPPSSVC